MGPRGRAKTLVVALALCAVAGCGTTRAPARGTTASPAADHAATFSYFLPATDGKSIFITVMDAAGATLTSARVVSESPTQITVAGTVRPDPWTGPNQLSAIGHFRRVALSNPYRGQRVVNDSGGRALQLSPERHVPTTDSP